ncbi:MAG: glycosyltransferase family 4 protein [Actinomycetota bacterium]
MLILHVTDCYLPLLGGIEVQVSQLAAHQAGSHEVAVFTTTMPGPGGQGRSREAHGPVDVYRAAARMPLGMPVHPLACRHLRELADRVDPDVVHFHMGGTAPSVQCSLRSVGDRPTVLTVHSVWTPGVSASYRALSAITRFPSWRIQLSTVSELCARPVEAATGTPVMVVGNGIDIDAWRLDPLPHDGVHVVSATRFARRKRIGALLRVLETARDQLGPGAPLRATIAGDGPQLESARAWVRRHGMEGWVHLPGRLDRAGLQELYRRADAYLAPVVLEAFSIAVLEAQAAGLAVVVRAQSGAAERLTDGVDALLADDDAGLASAVVRLVREPGLLEAITARNRTTPPPYDWDDVLERTARVYAAAAALRG